MGAAGIYKKLIQTDRRADLLWSEKITQTGRSYIHVRLRYLVVQHTKITNYWSRMLLLRGNRMFFVISVRISPSGSSFDLNMIKRRCVVSGTVPVAGGYGQSGEDIVWHIDINW